MFNDETYYTLISPSFFYDNKRIVLVSNSKDINKTIDLFWQNLSLLINDTNVEFYNLPMIIRDNITDKLFFISIKQSIVDYQLYREVKKKQILSDPKLGILGLGKSKKKYKDEINDLYTRNKRYDNLLNKADIQLNTLNLEENIYSKLESVFIFPIDKDQELYSIPSFKPSVDIILLNLN